MNKHLIFPGLVILCIVLAAAPLLSGHFFVTGDMNTVYIPIETFFQNQQRAGIIPAWNADAAWGFPVLASAQTGFFYPILLVARQLLPLALYFPLLWLVHVAAGAGGLYFFMRQRGALQGGAFLAAISFGLSAFVWQHATHLNIIFTLAWLPWQFVAVEYIVRQTSVRARHLALLAFFIGLPFLAGQIQIPVLLSLVTSTYWFYRRFQKQCSWRNSIVLLSVVAVFAMGISATQLAPTMELAYYSDRGIGDDFAIAQANQHSFPFYHLPTALFPRFFSGGDSYWGKRIEIEYGIFLGTVPLLLALWASRRVAGLRYMTALMIVSLLMALGDLSPFRALGIEPSLWYFTGPARWLLFTTFAAAILAGHGFDHLIKERKSFARFATVIATIVIGSVVVVNIVLVSLPDDFSESAYQMLLERAPHIVQGRPAEYYTDKLTQLIGSIRDNSVSFASPYTFLPLALLIGVPWLVRSQRGRQVLLGATAVELIIIAAATSPTLSLADSLKPPAALAALPAPVFDRQARALALLDTEDTDSGALLTNPDSRLGAEAERELRELLFPLAEAQFGVPGAAWPASLSLAGHTAARRGMLIETPTLLIDVARRNIGALVVKGELPEGEPIARLPAFDATVYEVPTQRAVFQDQEPSESATYTFVDHNTMTITTESDRDATLIIRDSFYPGWQATVDETPVAIERAESIFRSIPVPAGKHTIELNYTPTRLHQGLGVSIAALVALVLMLAWKPRTLVQTK